MGQALKDEGKRFRDWFLETTGINYRDRGLSKYNLDTIRTRKNSLQTILENIRERKDTESRGIIARIMQESISRVFQREEEAGVILDGWCSRYPQTGEGATRGSPERTS